MVPDGEVLRAIVVDDNRDAAESLARLLEAMGHAAEFVIDPMEAVAAVTALRPHIVFLDLGIPVIDGFELAARIRARYGFDDVRLVAITGYGTTSDRAKSRRAGFDAHLLKPASPDLIRSTIEELCKPRLK